MIVLASGAQTVRCAAVYDGDAAAGAVVWLGTRNAPIPTPDPSADPAARWTMLTVSERSVAEHVANGLTNRETASQLFISTHTVDYHLRQISGSSTCVHASSSPGSWQTPATAPGRRRESPTIVGPTMRTTRSRVGCSDSVAPYRFGRPSPVEGIR